jgi:pyruvate/2-oxoglutarate dehydrogenase complex dihydrolipoamide dehydrogenase (E3) component
MKESGYVTSDTLWDRFRELDEIPSRFVILGGGPIGCELAQSFARLGSKVILVEMAPRLMAREDEDVSVYVKDTLSTEGVQVLTSHKALRCEQNNGVFSIHVEHNGEEMSIAYDQLLCSVGRSARLEGFGLDTLGIEFGKTLTTNEFLQTKYPHIYGVGDVVGPYQLTHAAAHQAWFAAVNGLFGTIKKFKVDYSVLPWCTYLDPEVARVGLNEQDAKEKGIAYEVTRYELHELDRAITEGETGGFLKVLTPPKSDKILGVTMVGAHAGDLIAEFVLAMKKGLGLNTILGTVHSYPTWAEANKYVAGNWKKNNAPQTLLKFVEKYHAWQRGGA